MTTYVVNELYRSKWIKTRGRGNSFCSLFTTWMGCSSSVHDNNGRGQITLLSSSLTSDRIGHAETRVQRKALLKHRSPTMGVKKKKTRRKTVTWVHAPFRLVDERALLGLRQQLPLGAEPFRDLRVVHLGVLLGHFPTLTTRPDHEGVHRPLHAVGVLERSSGRCRRRRRLAAVLLVGATSSAAGHPVL